MITICAMRPLGDFVKARISKAGFESVDDFSDKAGVNKPSVYRVLNAEADQDLFKMHRSTLEAMAEFLHFVEWNDLVGAWKENDVQRGLDRIAIKVPRAIYEQIKREAQNANQDVEEYVSQILLKKNK